MANTASALSMGKARALQRASTNAGIFSIVAVDHQDALRQRLSPAAPLLVQADDLTAFKLDVVEALADDASAVLLDPVYGAAQAIQANLLGCAGLLVELEKADYEMKPLPLQVEVRPGWSVEKIKRMGADGVKLFFYYHPERLDLARAQEAVIAAAVHECRRVDLPLYAEPILVDAAPEARLRLTIVSAAQIKALGADVLKLEFPLDVRHQPDRAAWYAACEQLTEALTVPWVLLSGGVDFDTFCEQVEISARAGASGFIAGRALWDDACRFSARSARRQWLMTTGRARLNQLSELAARHGRPWTSSFNAEAVDTLWFERYAAWK